MSTTPTKMARRFLMAAAAGTLSFVAPPSVSAAAEDTSIRPYRVNVPQAALTDLRKRIADTRWPAREVVAD